LNLNKLFELQAKLDERIYKEHPVQEGEDRLAKKILALQVELGELANEWRGFKYWSNNQKPRTRCPHCEGSGLCHYFGYADPLQPCGYCNGYPKRINPLLEEYTDCLHFILSVGLDLRMDEVADELDFEYACRDIIDCFVYLNSDITDLYYVRENDDVNSDFYESLFSKFIRLGELLGFTWEQVEQAYLAKNKINHERQESGY
jgi:dimeric dUTPase (all-alpha-NTP-PPase superfamily)